MVKIKKHILILFLLFVTVSNTFAKKQENSYPELEKAQELLETPVSEINMAISRLEIEKMLNPQINISKYLWKIDEIVGKIKKMPKFDDSVEGRLNAIISYLYKKGEWNHFRPYQYDFSDPLGTKKPQGSFIFNYLDTKKGNCVSMPILLTIIGRKLGLDMSLAEAPKHLLVQLKDKQGNIYNIEATSGGLKRDASYVKDFLISQKSLQNKIYLNSLSKKEEVAVMLFDLSQSLMKKNEFLKSEKIVNEVLKHYPRSVNAMISKGNIYSKVLSRELSAVKLKRIRATKQLRQHLDKLLDINLLWFKRAEDLGWAEPPKDYDQRYLNMIKEVKYLYE